MDDRTKKLLRDAAGVINCERKQGCIHCQLIEEAERNSDPTIDGIYLLLCYEWVGQDDQKPIKPYWQIRPFHNGEWVKKNYHFNTGGYENFEAVRWLPLPPTD